MRRTYLILAVLLGGCGFFGPSNAGDNGVGTQVDSDAGVAADASAGGQIETENQTLSEMDQRIAEQDRILEENHRVIEELRQRGADARLARRGVVINLPDVLFEFDSALLKTDARRACVEIAEVLGRYPNRPIAVEGHTDEIGTIVYNQRLSEGRARAVAQELSAQGVPLQRMVTRGYGESDPISSNRTDAGRKRNRRVEVILENR